MGDTVSSRQGPRRAGNWQLQQNASQGVELAMAELGAGRLALQLTSTSTSVAGLHDVQVRTMPPGIVP